jgi:hypothetical protein
VIVDIVLGISMAPDSVQMVLLQGENADGATVDEREFTGITVDDTPTVSAADRVLAAILDTRDDAAAAGLELTAVGVACTDQSEAAALRDALTAPELENVMLVSAFPAATALTQFVGGAMGYERTAVLFAEPDTATLAVVETSDGSVADVGQAQLNSESAATTELLEMVAGLDELPTRPDGLFVVGSGVDIKQIKQQLEGATSLAVSAAEEPETALARGAALASATLFASATAALAYAQDPGTGSFNVAGLPEYLSVADEELGEDDVAYSALADEEASAPTVVMDASGESAPRRGRVLLVGTAVMVAAISAALALEVALGVGLRSAVGLLPAPLQSIMAPVEQAIAPELGPVVIKKVVAPKPSSQPVSARPPAAPVPAGPAVPVPAAPVGPAPVVVLPIPPAPVPQGLLPDSPASPPVVQAPAQPSPPAESPRPIQAPPPQSPPPNQPPPEQGPPPSPGRGGGHPGNPGDGGPVNGPGPVHGGPGGGPHGGGPGHGSPGGAPPEGSGPASGGETHSGGAGHGTPGGAPPEGSGPASGGETHSGSGPVGASEAPGSSGPSSGSETPGSSGTAGGSETPGSSGTAGGSDSGSSSNSSSSSSPSDSWRIVSSIDNRVRSDDRSAMSSDLRTSASNRSRMVYSSISSDPTTAHTLWRSDPPENTERLCNKDFSGSSRALPV